MAGDAATDARFASLQVWLNTFDIKGPHASASDLTDGVAIAQALHCIIPGRFGKDKLEKIAGDASDNERLKISNLKKLRRSLLDFYLQELHLTADSLTVPDEAPIAEGDLESLCQLLELLLGCAVQCADKGSHITSIMTIEDGSVQADLKNSIQHIIGVTQAAQASYEGSNDELRAVLTEKEELQHMFEALKAKYEDLVEQHDAATEEMAGLKSEAAGAGSVDTSGHDELVHMLRGQLRDAQETLQHEQSEFAARSAELQKELDGANRRLKIGQDELSDVSQLRDELDEARLLAAKVPKLEGQIERLSKNVKSMPALQAEAKELEEQNKEHLKRIFELENGQSQLLALESQIAQYKSEKGELESQLLEEQKRSDKLSFEAKRAKDALGKLEKEKEALQHEKADLDSRVSELSSSPGETLSGMTSGGGSAEMRAKLTRLEAENEVLRAKTAGGSADEQFQRLQSMLDDATARKAKLETENREQSLKILSLESDMEDSKKSAGVKTTHEKVFEQLARAERDLGEAQGKVALLDAVKAELARTQEELIQLKKEHSLVSLDQKSALEELKKASEAELAEKISAASAELQTKAEQLEASLKDATSQLAKLASIEEKYTALVAEKEQLERSVKDKMEQVNNVLMQKDDIQSKYMQLSEDSNSKLKAQEERYAEATKQLQENLRSQMAGSGDEEVQTLKLKLQITENENNSIKLENELANVTEQLKKAMEKISRQKEFVDSAKETLKRRSDGGGSSEEARLLKQQVIELEAKVQFETKSRENLRAAQAREQKLMSSAWYDLALQYQRLAAKDADRESNGRGLSFLARQRHAAVQQTRQSVD